MTEQQYLELIEQKLDVAIETIKNEMDLNDKDITNLQELYWENQVDFDEYGYEEYENRQQMFNHINSRSRNMKTLHMYKKMKDSPYFARIDFVFDGEDEAECCYIGIGNFSDSKGSTPLIYDWRAPISSLFYDFDTGRASYEAPAGMVEGEIVKKLQYKIKKGKLLYAVESDIKIDDDILKQALSMNADARLKSIVSTIQREQNAIIRNEKDKILVVQGAAGSGKTSVALHRIAYLLYRHRNDLKASSVLILSPNDIFADYISHILPELGEENIREMTFDDFAAKELSDIGSCESHYDFLESILNDENEANAKITERLAYRCSEDFAKELNAYVYTLEYEIMNFRDIKYKKFSKSGDEIADLFYNKLPDIPIFKRIDAICEYAIDEYTTLTGHEFDELELAIVQDKFASLYQTRDIITLYNDFLETMGEERAISPEDHKIKYEDVYALLYFKYLLYGPNNNSRIKHLVIDEMQDYSFIQFSLISNIFKCPMTILGDKEQSLEQGGSKVLEFLPKIFGRDIKKLVLDKSYRSTVEIVDFASRIAGIKSNCGIDRHGDEPKIVICKDYDEMYERAVDNARSELSAKGYETVAILCKTQREADYVGDKYSIPVINKETDRFTTGLVVVPLYLAKGLEFDGVTMVGVDKKHFYSDYHRQLLYIGATRALHSLSLFGEGDMCEIV